MQIKTTMRYHWLEWLSPEREEITSVGKEAEKNRTFEQYQWEYKLVVATMENSMRVTQKIETRTTI